MNSHFLKSLLWLFHLNYLIIKCGGTLLELNTQEPCYPSSERKRKCWDCLITSFIKCEIRHFHVVVVQWWQRSVQKAWFMLFCLLIQLLFWHSCYCHCCCILRSKFFFFFTNNIVIIVWLVSLRTEWSWYSQDIVFWKKTWFPYVAISATCMNWEAMILICHFWRQANNHIRELDNLKTSKSSW